MTETLLILATIWGACAAALWVTERVRRWAVDRIEERRQRISELQRDLDDQEYFQL